MIKAMKSLLGKTDTKGSSHRSRTKLLSSLLTYSRQGQTTKGFTLIELLISMMLATLILAPVLAFMVNTLQADRREGARANADQDLESALQYINRDLEQAFYIYDAAGLQAIAGELPANDATQTPVLVFWKRELEKNALNVNETAACPTPDAVNPLCNDAYVYSLVAYYLIEDNNDTWSDAARIGRFQIKGGISDPDPNNEWIIEPDQGYSQLPENDFTTWTKEQEPYENNIEVLVDYIDQSNVPTITEDPIDLDCKAVLGIDDPNDPRTNQELMILPSKIVQDNDTDSFYACVDSEQAVAQIYLRANALERLEPDDVNDNAPPYQASDSVYFPTATIKIQGLGSLGR